MFPLTDTGKKHYHDLHIFIHLTKNEVRTCKMLTTFCKTYQNIKLVKTTDILEYDHGFGYSRFPPKIDYKDYSISVFITLIKLSHCKQNKDCSIFFWIDSLRRPALEAAGEETVALCVLASK